MSNNKSPANVALTINSNITMSMARNDTMDGSTELARTVCATCKGTSSSKGLAVACAMTRSGGVR